MLSGAHIGWWNMDRINRTIRGAALRVIHPSRSVVATATVAICFALVRPAPAQPIAVVVPGQCNPWLAGMPDGTMVDHGDFAPPESPARVPFPIQGHQVITFALVSGTVGWQPGI